MKYEGVAGYDRVGDIAGFVLAVGGFGAVAVAGGVAAVNPVSDRGDCGGGVFAAFEGDPVSAGTGFGLSGGAVVFMERRITRIDAEYLLS